MGGLSEKMKNEKKEGGGGVSLGFILDLGVAECALAHCFVPLHRGKKALFCIPSDTMLKFLRKAPFDGFHRRFYGIVR